MIGFANAIVKWHDDGLNYGYRDGLAKVLSSHGLRELAEAHDVACGKCGSKGEVLDEYYRCQACLVVIARRYLKAINDIMEQSP